MKANDVKAFEKKDILETARNVLKNAKVCDHCLG